MAARAIAVYLAERQRPDGSFPGPDNYGTAFALWLWSYFGTDFSRSVERAWQRFKDAPPRSHGEFNIYALLQCRDILGRAPIHALIRRLRPGARHSANWMLLRAACDFQNGAFLPSLSARLEGRAALIRYARSGFIHDRSNVRSFGYHAFCGALLADIWRSRRLTWAGRAAMEAARFLSEFILPNGDALYVGRGQEQIFGYGALMYLLEAARLMTGDQRYRKLSDRVFVRLTEFQRRDGSLPLVLREGEEPEPWQPDARRPGWYTYNCYADYLPFFACMLLKASDVDLAPLDGMRPLPLHPDFQVIERERYTAVLSRPGGSPTNDLPFPYVCLQGTSIFPCYGREGDQIDPEAVALPYGVLATGGSYGFRDHLHYRFVEDGLIGESSDVRHIRRFEFRENVFECSDEIEFRRRMTFRSFVPANFLFRTLRAIDGTQFETWHREEKAILKMEPAAAIRPDAAVSASGSLVALRHEIPNLSAERHQTVSTRLKVAFP